MAQVVHLSADRDGLTMRRIAIKIGDREQARDDDWPNDLAVPAGLHTGCVESRDQILETIGSSSGVERERDPRSAARPSLDLRSASLRHPSRVMMSAPAPATANRQARMINYGDARSRKRNVDESIGQHRVGGGRD